MMKRWRIGAVAAVLIALVITAIWQWSWRADQELPAAAGASVTSKPVLVGATTVTTPTTEFYRDIKPILDQRCVVCHGCYDAPCQLKLDSPEGIQRGATHALVYDSARAFAAEPTRLFVDAHSIAAWRAKDFFSVLNERERSVEGAAESNAANSAENNLSNSVLYHMLALKSEHPLPEGSLPAAIDTSLDRKEFCPSNDTFAQYADERPQQGMPFGLPALSSDEFAKIKNWLETGASIAAPAPLSSMVQKASAEWERFFKSQRSQIAVDGALPLRTFISGRCVFRWR